MAETPRVLILDKVGAGDMTEISQQDLADSVRYIEKAKAQMDDLPLLKTAGKQDLGGSTFVGITNTLLNTQWGFEARTTSKSSGTITTADSDGILLTDNVADFVTDGVTKGALVLNLTDDGAVGTVLRVVDLHNLLLTAQMADGTDNQFDNGDSYKVWNVVQCKISGGNLVAVEADLITTLDSVFPTAFTQIVLASSSSATLQELSAIQYSSFDGRVSIDVISGTSGTTYPTGTVEQPVDNLADALTIAVKRGFCILCIIGDITFGATDNIDNYKIVGQGHGFSTFTFTSGCSANATEFRSADLQGTLDGGDQLMYDCNILTLTNFSGIMYNCSLHNTITLDGTVSVHFFNCHSGIVGSGTPTIDMGGSGRGLGMRAYAGGIKLINKSGSESVSIDFISGQLKIAIDVTAGTIVVRGVGKISENFGSATIQDYGLINQDQHDDIKSKVIGLY